MIDTGLAGKTAIVTGANHGIGAAIAAALAAQGASVLVHYFRPQGAADIQSDASRCEAGEKLYRQNQSQTAQHVVDLINTNGGQAEAWECDLEPPANVPILFDRAEKAFGPVDILINNAASWAADSFLPLEKSAEDRIGRSLAAISADTIDLHFKLISRTAALTMAEFARRQVDSKSSWGRIINISTSGSYCFPEEVSYGAAKFAVESYTRSAAKELGRFGITVNTVSPGATQTGWIDDAFARTIADSTPLGRVGQPDDVADVVVFLCSEQARWVSGQLIHVGGGSVV